IGGARVVLASLPNLLSLASDQMAQRAPAPSKLDGSGSRPNSMGKLALLDAAFASDLRNGSHYRRSEWLGADMQTARDESSAAGLTDDLLELLARNLRRSH
ncbi:MAG TPA: hypothetical protein VG056_07790, partial [Pirellulales bacterium]|nr:hypothetical protein [Pirellulales bacterium]